MFPTLLELGPIKLHTYGLMIAVGFLCALTLTQRDVKRAGLDSQAISEMGFVALFLGVLGTRILHIILFPDNYSWRDPIGWIAIWNGGLVFQGAIPITFAYAYIATRRRGMPFWLVVDCAIPYLALAQALGRMGCFFNGCCFGKTCDLPWAIRFPMGSPPAYAYPGSGGWSEPVHPTQLYSVAGLVFICLLLLFLRKQWNPFVGFTMPAYLILYGIMRFTVEMFRGDGNPTGLGGGYFTDQQLFSVLSVIVGLVIFLFLSLHSKHMIPSAQVEQNGEKKIKKKINKQKQTS